MTAICTAKAECAEEKSENNELVRLSAQINGEDTALLIRTDVFVQWAVAEALARAVEKKIKSGQAQIKKRLSLRNLNSPTPFLLKRSKTILSLKIILHPREQTLKPHL